MASGGAPFPVPSTSGLSRRPRRASRVLRSDRSISRALEESLFEPVSSGDDYGDNDGHDLSSSSSEESLLSLDDEDPFAWRSSQVVTSMPVKKRGFPSPDPTSSSDEEGGDRRQVVGGVAGRRARSGSRSRVRGGRPARGGRAARGRRHDPDDPLPSYVDDDKYSWAECDSFTPHEYIFDASQSGTAPQVRALDDGSDTLLPYFRLFFDDFLMNMIVTETNRYFEDRGGVPGCSPHSTDKRWKDTTVSEMLVFFALVILMPLVKKTNIKNYWRRSDLTYTDVFPKYMTRDRFMQIKRYLHFNNNAFLDASDKIFKVRPVYEYINKKFTEFFTPFQKLVIDESLVLFRGHVGFRQYIKTKRHRFGLKFFVLCDCETGIVLNSMLYTGKGTVRVTDHLGVSGSVVESMLQPYLGKGHLFYSDNYYTSPHLSTFLHEQNTGSCGTVRQNRKHMPTFDLPRDRDTNISLRDHDGPAVGGQATGDHVVDLSHRQHGRLR